MFDASTGSLIADRYRLVAKLGQGGMGTVWRAEDRALRIDIALKFIDAAFVDSPTAMARFEQEAHAAARLRSTHIVHINDYGVDSSTGQPFIAMDLLEGESLQERLDRLGKLPFPELQNILAQVARGLELAHSKGIAHRDLKPENIFLAREGDAVVVKVLDFGIAKRLDALNINNALKTGDGQMLGTPYYMSPEQAKAMSDVDHRTDIWAFGVIAFECLTGFRPFEGENVASLILKICSGSVPNPAHFGPVPAGFSTWFAHAVERDVQDRFNSIVAASDGLEALLGAPLERLGNPDSSAKTLVATVAKASSVSTTGSSAVTLLRTKMTTRRVTAWGLGLLMVLAGLSSYRWFTPSPQSTARDLATAEPLPLPTRESGRLAPSSASLVMVPSASNELRGAVPGGDNTVSPSVARTAQPAPTAPGNVRNAAPVSSKAGRVKAKHPQSSAATRQAGALDPGI